MKQLPRPKTTTEGFKDTEKENSIDDFYSASSLPHPQQGRRFKEGILPYDGQPEGDNSVWDCTTTEDLLEPVDSKTDHADRSEIDMADRFDAQPLSPPMALSRSPFASPPSLRSTTLAYPSTWLGLPIPTAPIRSPFRDKHLEDDGRAVRPAVFGEHINQNVETKSIHARKTSTDSIDLRSLFGSPPLPPTTPNSPLPSRPITPLVAGASVQQGPSSNPLPPSPKPAKPPVKREFGGENDPKPPKVTNKKLQRILNDQKPLRERKDPLRPVLRQTLRREFR